MYMNGTQKLSNSVALLNDFVLILNEASFFDMCEVTVPVILEGLMTVQLERS